MLEALRHDLSVSPTTRMFVCQILEKVFVNKEGLNKAMPLNMSIVMFLDNRSDVVLKVPD
jgi:hypothetical protein